MARSRTVLPLYLGADALSFLGNAMMALLLPWLVIARTGDAAAAALVAAAAAATQLIATAASGTLIDRFGARRMAVLADLGSTASVVGLAVVDLTVGLNLPWLLALGIGGALFDVPGMTARQTLMPQVATRSGRSLDTTSAARQSVFGLAFLVGPALGGALLAAIGPNLSLWVTAGCTLLAVPAMLAVRVSPVSSDSGQPEVRGAWGAVRREPVIVRLLLIGAMSSLVSAPLLSVLLPAHFAAQQRPDLLGFISSGFAVGILVGSVLYGAFARLSRRLVWTIAIVLMTAGLIALAPLGPFWSIAVSAVLVGVGSGLVNPLFAVVVAERIAPAQLGRVMALVNVVGLSAAPAGLAAAGVVLTVADPAVLAAAMAGGWVLVAASSLFGRSLAALESAPASGSTREHGSAAGSVREDR